MTDNPTPARAPTKVWAPAVRPGDTILWADRLLTVQTVDVDPKGLPGRWLTGELAGGSTHRLHYFDNEQVLLVSEAEGTE